MLGYLQTKHTRRAVRLNPYDKGPAANGCDVNSSTERSGELIYLLTLREIEAGS